MFENWKAGKVQDRRKVGDQMRALCRRWKGDLDRGAEPVKEISSVVHLSSESLGTCLKAGQLQMHEE